MLFKSRIPRSVNSGGFRPRRGPLSVVIGILFAVFILLLLSFKFTSIGSTCSVPGQKNLFGSKPACSVVFAEVPTEVKAMTSNQGDPNYPLISRGIRLNSLTVTPQQPNPRYTDLTVSITNTSKSHKWIVMEIPFLDSTGKRLDGSFNWGPLSIGAGETLEQRFMKTWTPTGKFGYALQVRFAF